MGGPDMKRMCSIFPMLFYALVMFGQTTRSVELDYNMNDFNLRTHNGLTFISSSVHASSYGMDITEPALPQISVKILIGPDEDVTGFDVSTTEQLAYNNIELPHNVPCVPTSEAVSINPFEKIEYKKVIYPDSLVQFFGVHSTQGYRYACFMVSPFTYRPQEKSLYINKINIHLSVEKKSGQKVDSYRECPLITKMVVNTEDIERLYTIEKKSAKSGGNDNSNIGPYDYIIVTCDSLKDIFQELANWKILKGVKTKVITVEDIYAQDVTNDANYIKIKRALDGYYDNGDGCKYILLGGDVNVIPAYMCYVQCNRARNQRGSMEIRSNYTVTDLFYSSFSDLSWNTNNNTKNGEISDNIDPSPSVSISRLPVLNRLNASVIIQRILDYEKGIYNASWRNNILMFGGGLDDSFPLMPNKSTAHYFCDTIYSCDIYGNGIERFRFYDTDSDYPTGKLYDLSSDALQSEMENGYHFIYGDTHGMPSYWALETDAYNNQKASVINNPIKSHIITNSCFSNDITIDGCLSKAFLWNNNSGLLSYFGSSVENWINPYVFIIEYSEFISHVYFQSLFDNSANSPIYKRLGDIVKIVKENIISERGITTYDQPYRWLLFSMNILGDPEMPVYISTPQKQNNITCDFSNGTLTVQTPYTPGDLGYICIMSLNNNGASYYFRSSIAYNQTYNLPSGSYSVCITHPGCIPYVKYVGNNVYIQNRTLSGDNEVAAKNVFVGRNVLTSIPQGPVTIINGQTKVKATNGVTLKNNFEVKEDAEFSIEMQN